MVPEKLRDQQAEIIEVKVDQFQFFIFNHENQIFIPTNEGLRVIGVNINWISAMGPKRKRILYQFPFGALHIDPSNPPKS